MKKTVEMVPRTYLPSKTRKTSPQTSVHTSTRPISCRGIDCKDEFLPKRKDQVFCSPDCRSGYFKVARAIGVILLERSKDDSKMKVIVDDLLEILNRLGQTEERE